MSNARAKREARKLSNASRKEQKSLQKEVKYALVASAVPGLEHGNVQAIGQPVRGQREGKRRREFVRERSQEISRVSSGGDLVDSPK